jgi:RNA polymerase sigma factor for flagellar operon FliA
MDTDSGAQAFFTSKLRGIQSLVRAISHRGKLSREDARDFSSYVMVKLIENDYARLRKFKGEASLHTYLTVVIQRLLLDYRRSQLGKWRPSPEARRLGAVAVELEELLWRDGYCFQEAVHSLQVNRGVSLDREALFRLSTLLSLRRSGKPVPLESAEKVFGGASAPAADFEQRELFKALQAAISREIRALSETERLTLRLRFERGLTAREIGAHLDKPPRVVYRDVDRSLKRLRRRLEGSGIERDEVRLVLRSSAREISFPGWLSPAPAPADA